MLSIDLVSVLQIGMNDVATAIALFLSASAVYLQYKSTRREVGDLEIIDVGEATYSSGGYETSDGMGGEFITDSHFHVRCSVRNRMNGDLYIHSVRAILSDTDESVELTHHSGELQLDGREPMFDRSFTGTLDGHSNLSGTIEATLLFETSSGPKSRNITFTKSKTSWDMGD